MNESLMITKKEFLNLYKGQLANDVFEKAGMSWEEVAAICSDHQKNCPTLTTAAEGVVQALNGVEAINSLRYRTKGIETLGAKILRKRTEKTVNKKYAGISISTYRTVVEDLVGIRALHLFKEDWPAIHDFILGHWDLHGRPVAMYREGDSEETLAQYKSRKCSLKKHDRGYRSVHYTLKVALNKADKCLVEVQVRTLFQEAWAEIDHQILYPFNAGDPLLNEGLAMLNQSAGNADNLASFIRRHIQSVHTQMGALETLQLQITELQDRIKQSEKPKAESPAAGKTSKSGNRQQSAIPVQYTIDPGFTRLINEIAESTRMMMGTGILEMVKDFGALRNQLLHKVGSDLAQLKTAGLFGPEMGKLLAEDARQRQELTRKAEEAGRLLGFPSSADTSDPPSE